MADRDIYRNYNFILDIGEGPVGYFTEVTGLSVDIEAIDYREGGAGPAVRKLAGRAKYGDITLKWGMSNSRDLWDWMMTAASGSVERRHISIILTSPGGAEQTRWNLTNAWPSGWRGAELDAMGNDAALESLTLVCEGMERA
jgi:phage tail-like protein